MLNDQKIVMLAEKDSLDALAPLPGFPLSDNANVWQLCLPSSFSVQSFAISTNGSVTEVTYGCYVLLVINQYCIGY